MNYTLRNIADDLQGIELGVSATNTNLAEKHNRQWFTARLVKLDDTGNSFNENYSSVNDEARFIATSDNTYITEVSFYLKDVSFDWNKLGGTNMPGSFYIRANVNGVVSHLTDTYGVSNNIFLKMNFPDFFYETSTYRIFARRDYSVAPIKLNTDDKIYITLSQDYSALQGFKVSVSGYVQN